jgi:hypothetical protein
VKREWKMLSNLVFWILHRDVVVEADGLRVQGRLVGIQEASRRGMEHKPMILVILSNAGQPLLLRDWSFIAIEENG